MIFRKTHLLSIQFYYILAYFSLIYIVFFSLFYFTVWIVKITVSTSHNTMLCLVIYAGYEVSDIAEKMHNPRRKRNS